MQAKRWKFICFRKCCMGKRNLYLSNTPAAEALETYLAALGKITPKNEAVCASEALGRVTAQAVFARYNSPLYDSAAMDGIAVIAQHTAGARENNPVTLRPKTDFVPADTGDPVRPPYDAVIMAEDLEVVNDGTVVIRAAAAPWQHLRPVGEDIVCGEMILPSGHKIRPIDIGVLLSGGMTTLKVVARPKVAVFPTGTELIEPDVKPKEGDIVESNSHMLAALVLDEGGSPHRHAPLADEYGAIKQAVADALVDSDMVIINAGSSAGTEDYTVHVLRELGQVIVHGVAMKPGKPVVLAIVNGKPVIGLPGYPVSAYLAYKSFVSPLMKLFTGVDEQADEVVEAVISRRLVSSLKHREFVRVKVGRVGTKLVASPLARGAGAAMSLVRADGFCVIDQNSEGVEAGKKVMIHLIRPLSQLELTLVSIGSHDLILDIVADMMPEGPAKAHLSSAHVGSMAGLLALQRGEAHIAPIHLLDEQTGTYNIASVNAICKGRKMALIKGVGRTQGIMVKKGNPLAIQNVRDLVRARYINRQRGAGTRVLLDHKLKLAGVDPAGIEGYQREAATHMAVAASVASGSADAGLGVFSAASAMGLDFVPVGQEEYDFAVPVEFLQLPHIKAFIEVLESPQFKKQLDALGGYDAGCTGKIEII